ncbi:major facilitator superfamily domain-containing protein [Colletotrichum godetiae]|uniref:Major facilitator superfamily domain-containing protein n=1 Tax=Colletotrichum godetiae TaxID=1209918 RepID=A0AAJ0APZ3_9PEZI|nr:major facilitator superfamily domain-containing protein [Colletotrichum godetiae]KAK1676397.1 major facilitator superfamily domain-containing protein [Colletotrichum godetiae]
MEHSTASNDLSQGDEELGTRVIDEKTHDPTHVEDVKGQDVGQICGLTEVEQKNIIRRIDIRLLPILGIMYSISLIDRTNLGLALVAGMQEDLELAVGNRYTVIVMVFFVAYILFEIPSNLMLPKAGPANWLSFLGVGFGVVLIGMGFTKSWGAMAVCRALLGILEAGFLPGCTYLITCWYTRFEVGKRLSGFWILSVLASGFSAIFAYVLTLLRGKSGLNGWSWIFIIEGAITVVVCALGWFIIIDFPTQAGKFLKPAEQEFIIARINRDRGDAEEDHINLAKILHHLKDWRLYFWAFNLMASTLPGYAYSYFLPIILRNGMGFSSTQAQLLSAPPYVLAAIVAYISGYLGDKYKIRGPIIAVHQALTAVGMLITVYGKANGARYFGAFLGIGFLQFCVPGVLTFQANNITSHSKRAVSSATCLIGGGLGGIIASTAFMSKESPHYTTGIWTTFAISMASITMIIIMDIYLWRCNKAAKAGQRRNEGMEGWLYTL